MKKWKLVGLHNAKSYIERKINNDKSFFWHLEYKTIDEAKKSFLECDTAQKLQDWIETYLQPDQIKKLRTYLRVEKSRSSKSLQNITLKADTRERLADYAKCYNLTLSEAIDKLLDECDKREKLF